MKNLTLPLAALVLLILASISIARTQPRHEVNAPPVAPPRAEFERRVAAVGLVEASSENISLSSHLPGVVEKVHVIAGQDVKAGEPLVTLDTRALEATHRERHADLAARQALVLTAKARVRKARASLSDVQRILRFAESVADTRSISTEELTRRRSAVEIAEADVAAAEAEVEAADAAVASSQAALKSVETDLERSTVTAPIDGRILQVRIRAGEFAASGASASPWLVMGRVQPLHLRVDIDEHEGWRVKPGARAEAQVRGNANLRAPISFVRFEPYVVPKQSLTGASTERVDTRVLQAIYRIDGDALPLFVGQQMDVFIDAMDLQTAMVAHGRTP